jgi:flavin-dependent dehydrogenase
VATKVLCTGIIGINAIEEFPLPWESVVGILGRMKAISRYGTEIPYTPPQPIAQMPLRQSHAERVLVIGEAAGQVNATTGGGIYYGLLAARLAADTISQAFATGCFAAPTLQGYERAWRPLLADELALGLSFRRLYTR